MKAARFNRTQSKVNILKTLSTYEVLTTRDLANLIDGNDAHSNITTINKTLSILNKEGLVNQIFFRPEIYLGRGNLPNASGLAEDGFELATDLWPETYPKIFSATHSPHTIEHDLRRARTHIAIAQLCRDEAWELGWKKGGYHLVKPDDTFEITKTKTAHFFLEEEHKKKDFAALYEKLKPYVDLHGTGEMKDAWGFRYYTVIIPMRDTEAMLNVLTHFKGGCNCLDAKLRYMHKNSPFKLFTDILWFTTHDEITTNPGGKIFFTSKGNTKSLMDIVI